MDIANERLRQVSRMCAPPVGRVKNQSRREDTPLRPLLLVGLLAATLVGCAPSTPATWTQTLTAAGDTLAAALLHSRGAAPGEGVVRVRLAFGEGADLDLFVSDPRQETVYFANKRSRSGGVLGRDLRCPDPAPRIESVEFEAALAGRYRVGVDYPSACPGFAGEAAYVVEISRNGDTTVLRGLIEPLTFEHIVREFDVDEP